MIPGSIGSISRNKRDASNVWLHNHYPVSPCHIFISTSFNEEELAEDQGFELASLEAAKEEAAGYLLEAANDHLRPAEPRQQITCTVKDEAKRPLVRLRLVLEVDMV